MNRTDNILVWTDGKVPDLLAVFFCKKWIQVRQIKLNQSQLLEKLPHSVWVQPDSKEALATRMKSAWVNDPQVALTTL